MMSEKRLYLVVAAAVFVLDQWSKWAVKAGLYSGCVRLIQAIWPFQSRELGLAIRPWHERQRWR